MAASNARLGRLSISELDSIADSRHRLQRDSACVKWSMSSVVVLSSLIALVGLSIVADQFRTSSQLNIRWVLLSFALLIAAVACRELDIARRFSSPQSWLQGHAFWHVLTSLSIASIYVYYHSETITSDTFRSE